MFCCRVVVFIFSLIFTVCAVCVNILPFFRKEVPTAAGPEKELYYLRHYEGARSIFKYPLKYSDEKVSHGCNRYEAFWLVSFILAIVGAAAGGIGMVIAFSHLFVRRRSTGRGMCIAITIFFILAFLCCGLCMALPSVMYATAQCSNTQFEVKSLKDQGLSIVEGFALACVSTGGFLILIFIECCS